MNASEVPEETDGTDQSALCKAFVPLSWMSLWDSWDGFNAPRSRTEHQLRAAAAL